MLFRSEREEAEAAAETSGLDHQLNAARDEYSGQQTGYAELKSLLARAEETYSHYKSDHADALKAAAKTDLPISDEARRLNRARAR